MENKDSETLTKLHFLEDKKAKDVFAKVDYFLKSGMHIQREHPKPEEIYRFIERHFDSLNEYYTDFFQLKLSKGGEELTSQYFYMDFEEVNSRGKIPSDPRHRRYMESAHIIIGMLFLKMYKLDANLELDSTTGFVELLQSEYEEEKQGLLKLIASTKNDRTTDYHEADLKKEIMDAFDEFEKLGWIMWIDDQKTRFKYLPSFERLRKQYQPQISRIDDLIKEISDAN